MSLVVFERIAALIAAVASARPLTGSSQGFYNLDRRRKW
jgi:hypothetical protein